MDQTYEEKLAQAKAYLGKRWVLHPANSPRKMKPPRQQTQPQRGARR